METLYPYSFDSNFDWGIQEISSTRWTREENKRFERALAIYDKETPERWAKVADMIPGKSAMDVRRQYEELEADVCDIEAGLVPIPGYLTSAFTLEFADNHGFEALRKRSLSGRSSDHERKKGVPWTEDEHRRFLMGLRKHGKGDWRNISRNFVISKTPTQVASHAQKYFLRLKSGGKDKRRPSIHDITTMNLTEAVQMEEDDDDSVSIFKCSILQSSQNSPNAAANVLLDWSRSNDGAHYGHQNPQFHFQAARYQVLG